MSEQIIDSGAMRPGQFGWRDWLRVGKRLMDAQDERNLALIAAGIAFYTLLAIFPAFAAGIAIWGLIADPAALRTQLELAEPMMPGPAFELLSGQLDQLVATNTSALGWAFGVSTLLALWSARAGVASVIRGLNAVYREAHKQNFLLRMGKALLLTVVLVLMALVSVLATLVVPVTISLLPLGPLAETAVSLGRWLVALGVLTLGLGVVYRYGPNRRRARVPWVTPGAIFAVLLWTLGSVALSYYFTNFGSYNELYGSIGAVIGLLLWFYISAYAILLGAQLNAEMELQTWRDTTAGAERPPGRRGAYVSDHVAVHGDGERPVSAGDGKSTDSG